MKKVLWGFVALGFVINMINTFIGVAQENYGKAAFYLACTIICGIYVGFAWREWQE